MRLNKEIRSKIVENAFKQSNILSKRRALTVRSVALSEKIRLDSLESPTLDHALKAAEKEIKLILDKRGIPVTQQPRTIFVRSLGVYVQLASEECTFINFNGYINTRGNHSSRPCQVKGCSDKMYDSFAGKGDNKSYPAGHEFVQEYRALILEGDQLLQDEKELRATVQAAVDSFHTVEKMIEVWPESKALVPKEIQKAQAPMPIALRTDMLNKLIGLPKDRESEK